MKQKGLLLLVFILCLLASAPMNVLGQSITQNPSEATKSALQTAIEDWTKDANHYGVSASVILKDGTEWVSSAGTEAQGKTLTPNHLIWMASITKTMTGAIIMKLAEEEKLGMDDAISRWLPAMDNIDPKITIRQLLNHTNGLANYTRNPELSTAISADQSRVFTAEELIGFVGNKAFAPGERTQYTNTSFVLLGMIAEKVAKKPIVQLYHERLWGPLKLTDIFLPGFESAPGPVATAWRNGQEVEPLKEMSLLTIGNSAFGLFSNARTISRWGRALFSDSFLSPGMRSQMLTFVDAAGNIPGESGAGLGIRKYNFLGREQWGHSGGSPLGSSLMIYDPATGITVTVIMNQGRGSGHFRLAPQLLEIASKGK
ncbi:MAG: beta-lactamase family protein [Roseivirga sp.]|nr:beta-lactamase family protein [Roseivirga sp.]